MDKESCAFHVTTAVHDSRTSQRMIDYKVRAKRDNGLRPKANPVWLLAEDEILITKTIAAIVKKDDLQVLAFNICGDHMHILLVCEECKLAQIVGKIKAISSKEYNIARGITTRRNTALSTNGKKSYNSLWTQKFGSKEIENDRQLNNTITYIETNRVKHELPANKKLQDIIEAMCCS